MSKKPSRSQGRMDLVPPIRSLLEKGVPSIPALDTYIGDLDTKLEDNTRNLDFCVQDILNTVNKLPGNREWDDPRDAIANMLSANMLEKDSCYDPEPEDVHTILSHISGSLEQHPGCEEAILQELLSLSSSEGLSLPHTSRPRGTDPMASMASLNIATDNCEENISQQWDRIALHLRRYFTDRLTKLPIDSQKQVMDLYENKRMEYIQSLSTLYPSEDVLIKYQTLRSQQLDHCFHTLLPDADSEAYNSVAVTKNCRELADIILKMIDEDFVIFNSGVFKKSFNIARAMHDMYLEKFSDEMSALVEDIWEEIEEIIRKQPPQSSSEHSHLGKGNSKLGKKEKAQSLESVLSTNVADEEVSTFSLPRDYMESILNVVTAVLHIEEHVESLLKCAAWDNAGISSKKVKRKGSLRGVLKTSSSPEPVRRPVSFSGHDDVSFSDSFSSFGSSLSALTDNMPAPKVVEKARAEERLRWEWKLMFKKISKDLSQCVDKQIRNLLKTTLDKELKDWIELHVLQTEMVREDIWGGKLDYPKSITKSVLDFMNELDFLLPFAKAGSDSVLHCVRTAFVDSANLCLQNFHVHLTKLSGDIPRNAPMKSLYAILSSAAYIRNHLYHYESVLSPEESSKKVFTVLYKQYEELVEALSKLTTEIHNNFMATSILHDTESNNWADTKEFFEGERCSFTIQMWNYHMRGLRHDAWSMCPPRLGQRIYSKVLHESIHILAKRYAHAKPSYRRTEQYRTDVLSILLCMGELLLPACSSVSMYLDVGHSQLPHYLIQNLCSTLLASVAIVTSPLDILYKVFKRGFYDCSDKQTSEIVSPVEDVPGSNTDWLSWIQPTIFQAGHKHYDDMQTTTALYIQCKLLLSQPEIDWAMIVKALVMKNFTLPILFLTQSVLNPYRNSHNSPRKEVTSNVTALTSDPDVKQLFNSIVSVLSKCSQHFPDAVAKAIVPVIDRCEHWVYMETKHLPGRDFDIPVWMYTIFDLMEPFVLRVLKPVLEYLVTSDRSGTQIRPVMTVLAELPCGCPPHNPPPTKSHKFDANKEFIDVSLRTLLGQMAEDVYVLPTSVCILMRMMQEQCTMKGIKSPHKCVSLKIIASCLKCKLSDFSFIQSVTGVTLSQSDKDLLLLLADCIYSTLVYTKSKSQGTPRLAGKFCKENKEWIVERIQSIGSYISSEIFETDDSNILELATNEFMAQLFSLLASNILDTDTGQRDLRNIHFLITNNFLWLEHHLDIQYVLPPGDNKPLPVFTTNMKSTAQREFDPAKEFDLIGTRKFDHETIRNFTIQWQQLLQSDLGLSEFGFRTLLYNRHEMQDGAYLEENEKKPVEVLRSAYENEARELG
ncbi:LOW QUALITY PROTEIN: uncharacterized protein KIAA0825-like [Pecten maximus]|uniref:LOW QUALITY PROTEIN: uncharacterized protein KIAA0825-like n=1 Tax=Pecten maximus TaxID=6579 RepID=UPI0014588736|nr:LOW QUALITY PROTEIN: uncharacterized protein KIAA0825-like [Pecten maximus]